MVTYATKAHLVGVQRHSPSDYKAIEAYHRDTGSTDPAYWQNVQRRAASQAQPLNVVFEHYERPGEWARVTDLAPEVAARVRRAAK